MAINWYIGCSGFYYKEWKELFYPKSLAQSKWFEYYCQHYNTLEINNTFYRFPELKNLQSWYHRSPDDFVFSVKVPRIITHLKKFVETESVLNDFYEVVQNGLQEKLGCILFQLPPGIHFSQAILEAIIQQSNKAFQNVVEFRHQSWWQPQVYSALQQAGITFCSASFPNLPDEVIHNSSLLYYRFHGVPKLYYSSYSHTVLTDIIQQIEKDTECKKAFVYFNNTASAAALENADFVKRLV